MDYDWKLELAKLVGTEWIVLAIVILIIAGCIVWYIESKTNQYQN